MNISKTVIFWLFLSTVCLSFPVPAFDPQGLVSRSDVVVFGSLRISSTRATEMESEGRRVAAIYYVGRITPKRMVFGTEREYSDLEVQWTSPTGAAWNVTQDRLYFLKKQKNAFTWTSDFYPWAWAEATSKAEQPSSSLRSAVAETIRMMCFFAEDTANSEDDRLENVHRLMFTAPNSAVVHAMAERLMNDPSPRIRDAALFIVLRYRDRRYLSFANEQVRRASLATSGPDMNNLLLALSQEFKEDSVPAFELALAGKNPQMRKQAAFAARYTQSNRVIPSLLKLVGSSDPETAWNAMHSLGELTKHMDWRPMSQDPAEFQRCIALWQAYAREQRFSDK